MGAKEREEYLKRIDAECLEAARWSAVMAERDSAVAHAAALEAALAAARAEIERLTSNARQHITSSDAVDPVFALCAEHAGLKAENERLRVALLRLSDRFSGYWLHPDGPGNGEPRLIHEYVADSINGVVRYSDDK